jgi:hypothetical protein
MAPLFPIIIAVIVVVSKIIAASQKTGNNPPPRPTSSPRPAPPPTESEQERLRRFMEAVGLPPDAKPPPLVRPRTGANVGPLPPVKPPGQPLYETGRLRRVTPPSPSPARRTQPGTRGIPPVAAPARASATSPPPPAPMEAIAPLTAVRRTSAMPPPATSAPAVKPSYPASGLVLRLRDPAAIREAIILREVLGPPKALQAGMGTLRLFPMQ